MFASLATNPTDCEFIIKRDAVRYHCLDLDLLSSCKRQRHRFAVSGSLIHVDIDTICSEKVNVKWQDPRHLSFTEGYIGYA